MEWNLVRPRRGSGLVTCSLCLRVRRGSTWVEPEEVIRELRSYELPAPPRLRPGLCADCADSILEARADAERAIAA